MAALGKIFQGRLTPIGLFMLVETLPVGKKTSRVHIQNAIENEAFPFIQNSIPDPNALLNYHAFSRNRNTVYG